MARRLTLVTMEIDHPITGERVSFSYAEVMMQMLRLGSSNPQRGMTLGEIEKAIDALEPIKRAVAAGDSSVTLSEDQHATLVEKLDAFPFSFADLVIVEFGRMIKGAPEIGAAPIRQVPRTDRATPQAAD
jgi:hypothetical protein